MFKWNVKNVTEVEQQEQQYKLQFLHQLISVYFFSSIVLSVFSRKDSAFCLQSRPLCWEDILTPYLMPVFLEREDWWHIEDTVAGIR